MNELAIAIYSCDKNEEVWPVFYHCLNKYWNNHPNIYLLTETIKCPYMNTISLDYDLDHWTTRIRNSLKMIKEKYVIFISDDLFLNDEVNIEKLLKCINILENDIYSGIQFELSWHENDSDCKYEGFKYKGPNSLYRLSLLCGIWKKDDLIDVLKNDTDPWTAELNGDNTKEFLQTYNNKILSWFNDRYGGNGAIRHGKWQHGVEDFLKQEGLEVDFSKKGFLD